MNKSKQPANLVNENQLKKFAKLLEEATQDVRAPGSGDFFAANFRTHDNVSYCAPPISDEKITEVVWGFEKVFGRKYTVDEIHGDVRKVFAARLQNTDHDVLGDLAKISEQYEQFNSDQTLIRRVSGVELKECSIKLGKVLLVPVGAELNEMVKRHTEEVFASGNLSEEEQEKRRSRFINVISEEFEGVSGPWQKNNSVACIATYTATPARALERSQEEIGVVIELLRYFGIATREKDIRIDFTEAYPSENSVAFVTTGRVLSLQSTASTDDYHVLHLDPEALGELDSLGVFQLADNHASNQKHKLKSAIAKGAHWLSLASGQRDEGNKIVLCIIALEAIFNRTGQDKVSDCCAFLLGVDAEGREHIAELIKKFYSIRNNLAHGGNAEDVAGHPSLWRLVAHTIWAALKRTGEHETPACLCQSFDVLKFSLPSDNETNPDSPNAGES